MFAPSPPLVLKKWSIRVLRVAREIDMHLYRAPHVVLGLNTSGKCRYPGVTVYNIFARAHPASATVVNVGPLPACPADLVTLIPYSHQHD